jgi:excisionase family DNA binding protein
VNERHTTNVPVTQTVGVPVGRSRATRASSAQAPGVADLSPQQAAERLGVSRSLVYRLIDQGEFPNAYQVSNRLRIPRADVDALRRRNRVRARAAPMYEPIRASRPARPSNSFAAELQAIKGGTM